MAKRKGKKRGDPSGHPRHSTTRAGSEEASAAVAEEGLDHDQADAPEEAEEAAPAEAAEARARQSAQADADPELIARRILHANAISGDLLIASSAKSAVLNLAQQRPEWWVNLGATREAVERRVFEMILKAVTDSVSRSAPAFLEENGLQVDVGEIQDEGGNRLLQVGVSLSLDKAVFRLQ